jgi:hypothetical protein
MFHVECPNFKTLYLRNHKPQMNELVSRDRPWPTVSYDYCNIPPLPADLDELTNRITAAVKSVTEDTLRHVWDEFSYHIDVVHAAGGGHTKHL